MFLDRGELTDLRGTARDQKLLALKYFNKFDPKEYRVCQCDNCGHKFVSESFYIDHKRKKGGCKAPSQEITTKEHAELLGWEEKDVVDNDRPHAQSFESESLDI
jgi:hypothetical protein